MIGRADIEAAYQQISPYIRKTPVMQMDADALGLGYPVTFKMEHLQATGSFKLRGAFNNLLTSELSEAGVVATSGGNHGAGVAYAATALGIPSTIYVPAAIAAEVKLRRMRGFGAEVVAVPDPVSDAYVVCLAHAARTGGEGVPRCRGAAVEGTRRRTSRPLVENEHLHVLLIVSERSGSHVSVRRS